MRHCIKERKVNLKIVKYPPLGFKWRYTWWMFINEGAALEFCDMNNFNKVCEILGVQLENNEEYSTEITLKVHKNTLIINGQEAFEVNNRGMYMLLYEYDNVKASACRAEEAY